MSFLLIKNERLIGVLLHVPKCGGTSLQEYLKSHDIQLFRPSAAWIGHLTYDQTRILMEQENIVYKFSGTRIQPIPFFAVYRPPCSWMNSIFQYAINSDDSISGLHFEKRYFSERGFEQYCKDFLKYNTITGFKDASIIEYNELSLRCLYKYYTMNILSPISATLNVFHLKSIDLMVSAILELADPHEVADSSVTSLRHNLSGQVYDGLMNCSQKILSAVDMVHKGTLLSELGQLESSPKVPVIFDYYR